MKLPAALLILEARNVGAPRKTGSRAHPRWVWTKAHDRYLGRIRNKELAIAWDLPHAEIQRRRVVCRIPDRLRKAVVWTKTMLRDLGAIPDAEFATRHGVSIPAICKKRKALEIPLYDSGEDWTPTMRKLIGATARISSRTRLGHPADHPTIRALFGTAADRAIAEQLGTSTESVSRWRMHAGIKSFHRARWTPRVIAKLGQVSDSSLARKLKVDVGTVRYQRIKRGIPLLNRRWWPDETIAQLGRIRDDVLAERMDLTVAQVRYQRKKRGIPPVGA